MAQFADQPRVNIICTFSSLQMELMAGGLVVQVMALVFMLYPARVSSLFEDQVGNYDW